jgi:hypothetical protein
MWVAKKDRIVSEGLDYGRKALFELLHAKKLISFLSCQASKVIAVVTTFH